MPVGAPTFKEALRWCAEVFHTLKKVLKKRPGHRRGRRGRLCPQPSSDEEPSSPSRPSRRPATSPATTSCWPWTPPLHESTTPKGKYELNLPKAARFTSAELVDYWKSLVEKYPIISIEDGMAEEDWEGWKAADP